jgi:hypothetical protein
MLVRGLSLLSSRNSVTCFAFTEVRISEVQNAIPHLADMTEHLHRALRGQCLGLFKVPRKEVGQLDYADS